MAAEQAPVDKAAVRALCPDTAAWLNTMVGVFGRPQAVRVTTLEGVVVYEYGTFDDERERTEDPDDDEAAWR
jgi:hypothetical protein